ncbi:type IV pilin protein [Hahella sp. SMD15-11]|uniref:Type IV pilin protein n=1 Tax=Thermohahella caldifontis TaxID=3142973 RepID=A0AB39USH5_9GAMM
MDTDSVTRSGGFTLVELMIVLVIAAILAAVAIPSYTEHVRATRRDQAVQTLHLWAQAAERYRSRQGSFLGYSRPPETDPETGYTFSLSVNTDGAGFTASASPTSGGPMQGDACGTLTLNEQGILSHTGSGTRCPQ